MLSKDEEQRLEQYLEDAIARPLIRYRDLEDRIRWLAEKLKEVNEELKALIQEDVKDCNCEGISHVNECPKWVLPF